MLPGGQWPPEMTFNLLLAMRVGQATALLTDREGGWGSCVPGASRPDRLGLTDGLNHQSSVERNLSYLHVT